MRFAALLIASLGLAACGGGGSTPSMEIPSAEPSASVVIPPTPLPGAVVNEAAQLCASVSMSSPAGPTQPVESCATGITRPGNLDIVLCNTTGIPAAGLNGFSCAQPLVATVEIVEDGAQQFTAILVQNALAQLNEIGTPLYTCQNNNLGAVGVVPASIASNPYEAAADFYISQLTPDWYYGAPAYSNQCAVAIWDTHRQFILVNVGFQLSGGCANTSCSTGLTRIRESSRIRTFCSRSAQQLC